MIASTCERRESLMITVLGSINMDLMAGVSLLPRPGETVPGRVFTTACGGKGANQALAARRAGAAVRMVGAVGNDGFSASALDHLAAAAVDLTAVRTLAVPTGAAMIVVDENGENMIAVVPGANGMVDSEMALCAVNGMNAGDIMVLQMETPAESVKVALNRCRERGILTILNTAPFTDDTPELTALADIVISNEGEFERLSRQSVKGHDERLSALRKRHAQTGQTFVVTLGAEGVIAVHNGTLFSAQGLEISPVDTVGAGDTFCGYFASGLSEGLEFSLALRRAAVAASIACLSRGAQTSIPIASVVEERL